MRDTCYTDAKDLVNYIIEEDLVQADYKDVIIWNDNAYAKIQEWLKEYYYDREADEIFQ